MGADEVAELDANGVILRRFIPDGTGAMDRRVAQVSASGEVGWFHTDHQGSVIAITDASGHAVQTASYSPYGEFATPGQMPSGLGAGGGVFGYTGRQYDAETGLYQYRARYYHPRLGQFLSTDPIGTKDDPNLTLYVLADPVNLTDPTGKSCAHENNQIACRIDYVASNGSSRPATQADRARYARVEREYTAAARQLERQVRAGDRPVNINLPNGETVQIRPSEVLAGVMRHNMTIDLDGTYVSRNANALHDRPGTFLAAEHLDQGDLQVRIVHESGIHGSGVDQRHVALHGFSRRSEHSSEYGRLARRLLREIDCDEIAISFNSLAFH